MALAEFKIIKQGSAYRIEITPAGVATHRKRGNAFFGWRLNKLDGSINTASAKDATGYRVIEGFGKAGIGDFFNTPAKVFANGFPELMIRHFLAELGVQMPNRTLCPLLVELNAFGNVRHLAFPVAGNKSFLCAGGYAPKVLIVAIKAVIDTPSGAGDECRPLGSFAFRGYG